MFQSTDLFVMASNSFQQAKSIFEVVNNVHNEVSSLPKKLLSFQQAKSIFEVVNNVHSEVSSLPKKQL